jgi:hypothetical protein
MTAPTHLTTVTIEGAQYSMDRSGEPFHLSSCPDENFYLVRPISKLSHPLPNPTSTVPPSKETSKATATAQKHFDPNA